MIGSEPIALPLGDGPIFFLYNNIHLLKMIYYFYLDLTRAFFLKIGMNIVAKIRANRANE